MLIVRNSWLHLLHLFHFVNISISFFWFSFAYLRTKTNYHFDCKLNFDFDSHDTTNFQSICKNFVWFQFCFFFFIWFFSFAFAFWPEKSFGFFSHRISIWHLPKILWFAFVFDEILFHTDIASRGTVIVYRDSTSLTLIYNNNTEKIHAHTQPTVEWRSCAHTWDAIIVYLCTKQWVARRELNEYCYESVRFSHSYFYLNQIRTFQFYFYCLFEKFRKMFIYKSKQKSSDERSVETFRWHFDAPKRRQNSQRHLYSPPVIHNKFAIAKRFRVIR